MDTDRIVKTTILDVPRERAWQAIGTPAVFGTWFGIAFDDDAFVPGQRLAGRIVPTQVDDAIAAMQAPYAGMAFVIDVERVEPPRALVFRWHPYAVEKQADYDNEPMTTVAFELEEVEAGTRLVITESGYDALPESRRDEAYRANEGGWALQLTLVAKYLAR